MNLTSENVSNTFLHCLFKEGEDTTNHVVTEGVRMKVHFNRQRLEKVIPIIELMLNDLPDEFKTNSGGGSSFLNACLDKNGKHWAEHQTIDQLVCLGIATGKLRYLMSREMWHFLPGGMPYFVVS